MHIAACTSPKPKTEKIIASPPAQDTSRAASFKKATSITDLTQFTWSPKHASNSGYMCDIQFEQEYAVYDFHGQCAYFFFTATTYVPSLQQVQLIWTYKSDCTTDMKFIEQPNGIKKHPKQGDVFAIFTLLNDTTLQVKYNFPEWVKKVNTIAGDSLFPAYYYLKQD